MKPGDVVMVYRNALAQQGPEGKARLVRRLGFRPGMVTPDEARALKPKDDVVRRWLVRFEGETQTRERWINEMASEAP